MAEIMTVIAVLAVLGSMLMTSIHNSHDLNNKVVCLSNLNQIRNIAELHRQEYGQLPMTNPRLTDFSFAIGFLEDDVSLNIFNCPGDESAMVSSYGDLTQDTSYYFVPTITQLNADLSAGLDLGAEGANLSLITSSQGGIIYDKSESHHNGSINIVYLFDQGAPVALALGPATPPEPGITLDDGTINFIMTDGNDQIQFSEDGDRWKIKAVYNDGEWEEELWFDIDDVVDIRVFGLGGDDQIQMNSSSVPIYMDGGTGDDQLEGGDGDDTIIGGPGNDQIQGGNGDDNLNGGEGDDAVEGGSGDDIVEGGPGNDDVKE